MPGETTLDGDGHLDVDWLVVKNGGFPTLIMAMNLDA